MNHIDKTMPKGNGGSRNEDLAWKKLAFPKGRVLNPEDTARVETLIGQGPYKRDLLIEYLHKI
ncbi:MAG: hypothetical protein WBD01_00365, partial [Salaquimonas sp.]